MRDPMAPQQEVTSARLLESYFNDKRGSNRGKQGQCDGWGQ